MISIAIVVVLMIGITKVFSLTANTAGATNTIASGIRDARAAQTTFYNDLDNTASDMPFMILRCGMQQAFRNKADALGDRDQSDWTVDLNGDNIEGNSPGETYNPTSVNNRVHRIDVFSFFANGLFARQTGNQGYQNPYPSEQPNGVYLSGISSNEAWIWYGHLRLANNNSTPTYFDPGNTSNETTGITNDNNKYASDWVLGRFVNVLKAPSVGRIKDPQSGHYQYYETQTSNQQFGWSNGTFSTAGAATADYTPFSYRSRVTSDGLSPITNSAGTTITTQSGRYDLMGTTISQMSQQVSNYVTWLAINDPTRTWWTSLMTGDLITTGRSAPYQGQTFVNGINSDNLAYTAPLFVQHCSQFIVEYAGDFLNQDALGNVLGVYSATSYGTDGYTDFYIDANGNRQIRWYGFPRDTLGTGVPITYTNGDVVPLRDLWVKATTYTDAKNPNSAPFEKNLPISPVPTNYATAWSNPPATPLPDYECVWGPSDPKPRMIRITMTIDDPTGKLPDGQTFQYVIALH